MRVNFRSFVFILLIANFIFTPLLYGLDESIFTFEKEPSISMDLQDASLKDVLKILSIQSNLNFVASEAVQERKLTLYMDKVPLKEAMGKIFKANNLTYDLDKEASIFIVKDWGRPGVETITEVFYLKHATVSSSSLKEEMKNGRTSESASSGAASESSSSSSSSSGSDDEDKGKWKVEDEGGITHSIRKLLSENGSVIEDFRTNSLIVTDVPMRMEVIRKVVASLDISVPQIMLEVEMLDVAKGTVDQMGVNWPQPLVTADFSAAGRVMNPFGNKGTSGQDTVIDYTSAATSGFLTSATWGASHFGPVILGILNGQVTLDFLRTQTDTKFLARPKILTLNNETAEIKITTNEAIGVSSVQEGTGTASSTTVSAERYETGVSLRVTPQVDISTGEITMFVFPKVAEASTTKSSFAAGSDTTKTYTFVNPEIRSTKSTVRVKDGETIVLGGLIRNQTTTTIKKIPVLGDIPFLGKAFVHKEVSPGQERELLVFITPRIVMDSGYTAPGEKAAQPVKKMMLPPREQSTVSVINRQSSINTYLNTLDKQR